LLFLGASGHHCQVLAQFGSPFFWLFLGVTRDHH
jgi:hypothetical protein